MTITELFERATYLADLRIDNADLLASFNEFQRRYSSVIYNLKDATITKVGDEFPLPEDYVGGLKVTSPTTAQENIRIIGDAFEFDNSDDADECDITYQATVSELLSTDTGASPDIPAHLHDIYAYYAAMVAMVQDDETERYAIIKREFSELLQKFTKYYSGLRGKAGSATSWKVTR